MKDRGKKITNMTTQQIKITGCKKSENKFAQHYLLMYAVFDNDDNVIINSQSITTTPTPST
jgi:hypothetical protein